MIYTCVFVCVSVCAYTPPHFSKQPPLLVSKLVILEYTQLFFSFYLAPRPRNICQKVGLFVFVSSPITKPSSIFLSQYKKSDVTAASPKHVV